MTKLDDFLAELAELTHKYEMHVAGCGDCGSPWIETYDGVVLASDLEYVDGDNGYKVGSRVTDQGEWLEDMVRSHA